MDALKKKVGEAVQSVIEDEFGKKLASHFVHQTPAYHRVVVVDTLVTQIVVDGENGGPRRYFLVRVSEML